MARGGFPALHHNGGACASCSPAVIEKEIAQLKGKKGRGCWGGQQKQSGPRRRVLCVISALFPPLRLQMGQTEIIYAVKTPTTSQFLQVSRKWVSQSVCLSLSAKEDVWVVRTSWIRTNSSVLSPKNVRMLLDCFRCNILLFQDQRRPRPKNPSWIWIFFSFLCSTNQNQNNSSNSCFCPTDRKKWQRKAASSESLEYLFEKVNETIGQY